MKKLQMNNYDCFCCKFNSTSNTKNIQYLAMKNEEIIPGSGFDVTASQEIERLIEIFVSGKDCTKIRITKVFVHFILI